MGVPDTDHDHGHENGKHLWGTLTGVNNRQDLVFLLELYCWRCSRFDKINSWPNGITLMTRNEYLRQSQTSNSPGCVIAPGNSFIDQRLRKAYRMHLATTPLYLYAYSNSSRKRKLLIRWRKDWDLNKTSGQGQFAILIFIVQGVTWQ